MQRDLAQVDLSDVALFPLPEVLLLPHGMLPLHLFEQRYRDMMEDVLEREEKPIMAMASLAPGWKQNYMGRPDIHKVVCVGVVSRYERLDDGRFNLVLGGAIRANIVREIAGKSYRRAVLEPIVDINASEDCLLRSRLRLRSLCIHSALRRQTAASRELLRIIDNHSIEVPMLLDILLHALSEDSALKQLILAEADLARRLSIGIDALEAAYPPVHPAHRSSVSSLN